MKNWEKITWVTNISPFSSFCYVYFFPLFWSCFYSAAYLFFFMFCSLSCWPRENDLSSLLCIWQYDFGTRQWFQQVVKWRKMEKNADFILFFNLFFSFLHFFFVFTYFSSVELAWSIVELFFFIQNNIKKASFVYKVYFCAYEEPCFHTRNMIINENF